MTDRTPQRLDIIECDRNFPELYLTQPDRGTIVECFGSDAYEIEFCNSDGETRVMLTLERQNTTLNWNSDRNTWSLTDLGTHHPEYTHYGNNSK